MSVQGPSVCNHADFDYIWRALLVIFIWLGITSFLFNLTNYGSRGLQSPTAKHFLGVRHMRPQRREIAEFRCKSENRFDTVPNFLNKRTIPSFLLSERISWEKQISFIFLLLEQSTGLSLWWVVFSVEEIGECRFKFGLLITEEVVIIITQTDSKNSKYAW